MISIFHYKQVTSQTCLTNWKISIFISLGSYKIQFIKTSTVSIFVINVFDIETVLTFLLNLTSNIMYRERMRKRSLQYIYLKYFMHGTTYVYIYFF